MNIKDKETDYIYTHLFKKFTTNFTAESKKTGSKREDACFKM